TQQRLGKIPLVVGMPVMITNNFDVEAGIVNGCVGTLNSIRYTVDGDGNRHARSCVVDTPDTSGEPMPRLAAGQSPVIENTVDI
ncbi:hypothetical protein BJ138DRAFT_991435, partial [Hygrophoropsis aurantiaca]